MLVDAVEVIGPEIGKDDGPLQHVEHGKERGSRGVDLKSTFTLNWLPLLLVDVLVDHVVGDRAGGDREVASGQRCTFRS